MTQRCSVPVSCAPESSSRAAPSGTNWNQHDIYAEHKRHKGWDTCANSFGSIADDPMTKNIQNSTGCNATIIRESVTVQSISVISNVDNIRRRLQRAMKETRLLNSQDIDRVVEDSLDEEGEEMVADDVTIGQPSQE